MTEALYDTHAFNCVSLILHDTLISLDLEMNQPSGKIIEIGAVAFSMNTGSEIGRFQSYVNPAEEINPEIQLLCHVDQTQIDESPQLKDVYKSLCKWLNLYPERHRNPLTWGGGDSEVLRSQLSEDRDLWAFGRRWIDVKTVYLSWRMAYNQPSQGGLARSMRHLGLSFVGTKHMAADDAANTARMYFALLERIRK